MIDNTNVCSMLPNVTVTPKFNAWSMNTKPYNAIILSKIPANPNVRKLIGVAKNFNNGLAT